MKRSLLYPIIFIIALTLAACSLDTSDTTQTVPLNYKEVERLAKSERIEVESYKEIGASFTVIMFNGGFYTAYKQNGEIYSRPLRHGTSNNPVSTAGVSTGFPFVTISINDKDLIEKGNTIEVVWEDGTKRTEKLRNRSAIIIPYSDHRVEDKIRMRRITIMDEDKKIICENN
jgi:hypothetical protein